MASAAMGPAPSPIAVVGLWHLGVVIAACLAAEGFDVVGVDPDEAVIARLNDDHPPVDEPGLVELLRSGRATGRLTFAAPAPAALRAARLVWIAFDTPVDDEDRADVDWVLEGAVEALGGAGVGALVVVSSQLPVGSVARLERRMADSGRHDLRFACVPENLRLGKAIDTFSSPDRFVAGVRAQADADELGSLLNRFGPVEWMGVESAEMTKHALNAFLATSVAFINELAAICERVGADAAEVARGLKSEQRIGPRAYLSPGDAFAGGTLARDIRFLADLADARGLPAHVVRGVATSNREHRNWSRRALASVFESDSGNGEPALADRRIAIWGLTYKPGTDTLRRSSALELTRWLATEQASVRAYDPAVRALPSDQGTDIELVADPLAAVDRADALVVCTPWPEFRAVPARDVARAMAQPIVLDPGGHLQDTLGHAGDVRYLRVGAPIR
jgi:UDPglucose 6-dehydrogenase